MEWFTIDCGELPATLHASRFSGRDGVDEYHLLVRPTACAGIDAQLEWLQHAHTQALATLELGADTCVLRRFFCSDLVNQAPTLRAHPFANAGADGTSCAVSWVGQAPSPPAKVSLWSHHIQDRRAPLEKRVTGNHLAVRRGSLTHHWTTGMSCLDMPGSYEQTRAIFESYETTLRRLELRLADHVIRTWLYVRDIDANYQGLVTARREFFAARGLTAQTHFIASSGIEGAQVDVRSRVNMDAYAIGGVSPEQISYLAAPDHLSPTHVYGVTFERGTAVAYADRRQVYLSGTASIDREGKIVHPGDVIRQLDRTTENVEAVLKQAGAAIGDMSVLIVYVRDASDQEPVRRQLLERLGNAPVEVVVASVCRPGWLVEVEGCATIPASNPTLPPF